VIKKGQIKKTPYPLCKRTKEIDPGLENKKGTRTFMGGLLDLK